MDDTPNQGSDQGPTPPDDAAPSSKGESGSERKLIEAAFEGAQPASGWPETSTAWFEGAPLPPHGAFPGYDIVREIHRGGQGVVYQAVQLSTRRHVAIKVMHAGPFMGSSGRARFEREVQVLGQLDHPNIVGIHDSGVTKDGSCFYVMDYISGKPLDKLMAEGQLPIRESLRLFAKICDAVNAAHLKGVIHRDLKPANIRIDKHGEPIVVDFGLAKLAIPDLDEEGSGKLMSMTGQFIGSLPWASPEQAEGSPTNIDVRTDVYSLGVILYQLLTNRFPYEVLGNMRDVLDNIVRAEPARPSTIRRKINDEVETIVLKSLSKQRERRYQSAGELGRDVHRFLEGQPIEAKRDSGWYVLTKTMKRYRVPVAVAGGSLVALVVFAVVITVLYEDAKTARGIAEQETIAANLARTAEAEQRQLAEDRLENAYDMAGTMLTEYYDAIRDLRGATEAKLALAESAMASLDELEGEAAGDPQRLLLVAKGRIRLGDLYAGRGEMQRVGGLEKGLALYESASRILDDLAASDPGSFAIQILRAEALAATAQTLRHARDYDRATQFVESAIQAYDNADDLAAPGSPESVRARLARADTVLESGVLLFERSMKASDDATRVQLAQRGESRFDRGAEMLQAIAAAAEGPNRDRALHGVAQSMLRRGFYLTRRASGLSGENSSNEALQHISEAISALSEGVDTANTLAERHPAASGYAQTILALYDAWGNALNVRASIYDSRADVAADNTQDLAFAQGARREAIEILDRAIDVAQRAAQADESNVALPRNVAHLLGKRALAYEGLGELQQAQTDYADSISVREALVRSDPTGQHLDDAVVGWFRMGRFHHAQVVDGNTEAEQDSLRQALAAFQQALAFVQRQVDSGISPDNTNLDAVQSRIDSVRAQLSPG